MADDAVRTTTTVTVTVRGQLLTFEIDEGSPWTRVRCGMCNKTTELLNPSAERIESVTQSHACGQPGSPWHRGDFRSASPAPAHELLLRSIALTVREQTRGVYDDPGVQDARLDLLEALEDREPIAGPDDPPETLGDAPAATEDPIGEVWVTVSELLAGRPLPIQPGTGAPACGVSFLDVDVYCTHHLLVALASGELAEPDPFATGQDTQGRVLFQTPTSCADCNAEPGAG